VRKDRININVHRFNGDVAVSTGTGSTVYIDPVTARALARSLNKCASDVLIQTDFSQSQFKSWDIGVNGKIG
jgi:hypothetical protein